MLVAGICIPPPTINASLLLLAMPPSQYRHKWDTPPPSDFPLDSKREQIAMFIVSRASPLAIHKTLSIRELTDEMIFTRGVKRKLSERLERNNNARCLNDRLERKSTLYKDVGV